MIDPQVVPTIAERVGELITKYLKGGSFSLGSMGSGSELERQNEARWRSELGDEAAKVWSECIGRDPEAARIVELVQYRAGFIPGSQVAIRASDYIRENFRTRLPELFA